MKNRLLSELIPAEKLQKSSWYSYFLEYQSDDGARELLPSDNHSAAYPLTINNQGEIVAGKINFFNKSFKTGFNNQKLNIVEDIELFIKKPANKSCLIINLLDNCYGHSLLKMFNIPLFYEEYSAHYDLIVIAPQPLKAFIPKESVNVIIIKKSFQELESGYELTEIIKQCSLKYEKTEFAFLNTYQQYLSKKQQLSFFNFLNDKNNIDDRKNIIFYYRKEKNRRWGLFSGKNKIVALFRFFRVYFQNIDFIVLGEKDSVVFPENIRDFRCESFNEEIEYSYNKYFSKSLLVVGVHGSHLILPSLLARQTFHLVPDFKMKNTGEDVFNLVTDKINNYGADVHIPVNGLLSKPSSRMMAETILVQFLSSLQKEYKCLDGGEIVQLNQEDYIRDQYPEFKYSKALTWWNDTETKVLRINKILKF